MLNGLGENYFPDEPCASGGCKLFVSGGTYACPRYCEFPVGPNSWLEHPLQHIASRHLSHAASKGHINLPSSPDEE